MVLVIGILHHQLLMSSPAARVARMVERAPARTVARMAGRSRTAKVVRRETSSRSSPPTASRSADTSCPVVGARRGRDVPFPTNGVRSRSRVDAGSVVPCIT